jgi:hypothetical protein
LSALASIPPERWGGLRLTPHPSASRLDLETNAYAIWTALKEGADPPPVERLQENQKLIVWRDETMPKLRPMGPEEAMMWDEAAKGATFGALCELVAVFDDPESAALRAAQHLQGWIVAGLLRSVVAERRKRSAVAERRGR